jgi:glycerate dehydrogenase
MNVVILDGYAANPGDLSWDAIAALCGHNLTVFDRTPREKVVERARGMQAVLTNKAVLDADALAQLPDLRYIGIIATGYNTVDVAAARAREIPVCNAPGYGRDSVAQHVFALLLELSNQVGLHARSTAAGEWSANPDWTYQKAPMTELAGKTLGIVGLGEIGSQVARIALAFGMQVLANSRSPKDLPGVERVTREQLFAQSDVVSLNCPLTEENRTFVNAALLRTMKPTAFLINTARGPLIDEVALAQALNEGCLAGAGLDVLSEEPPAINHPLFQAKNCIITPHNAWGTRESRARLIGIVAANLRAFLAGAPVNVVNAL